MKRHKLKRPPKRGITYTYNSGKGVTVMEGNVRRTKNRFLSLLLAVCMAASLIVLPEFERTAEAKMNDFTSCTISGSSATFKNANVSLTLNLSGVTIFGYSMVGDTPSWSGDNTCLYVAKSTMGSGESMVKKGSFYKSQWGKTGTAAATANGSTNISRMYVTEYYYKNNVYIARSVDEKTYSNVSSASLTFGLGPVYDAGSTISGEYDEEVVVDTSAGTYSVVICPVTSYTQAQTVGGSGFTNPNATPTPVPTPQALSQSITLNVDETFDTGYGSGANYTNSDSSIASVSSSGVIMGLTAGTATITAGNSKTITTYTVTVKTKSNPKITAETVNAYVGRTVNLNASSTSGGALTYESNDTSILTINSSGVITGVKEGMATVTVYSAATSDYNAGSETFRICVNPNDMPANHVRTYTWTQGYAQLTIEMTQPGSYIDSSTGTICEYPEDMVRQGSIMFASDNYPWRGGDFRDDYGYYKFTMKLTSGYINYAYGGRYDKDGTETRYRVNDPNSIIFFVNKINKQSYTRFCGYGYTSDRLTEDEDITFRIERKAKTSGSVTNTYDFTIPHKTLTPDKEQEIGIEDFEMEIGDTRTFSKKTVSLPSDIYLPYFSNVSTSGSAVSLSKDGIGYSVSTTGDDNDYVLVMTTRANKWTVTAKNAGTATMTVVAPSRRQYKETTKTVNITVKATPATLTLSDQTVVYGTTNQKIKYNVNSSGKVTFKSLNTDIAEVDENTGLITTKGFGTATIKVMVADNGNYTGTEGTLKLTVKPDILCNTTTVNTGQSGQIDAYVPGDPSASLTYALANSSDSAYLSVSNTGYFTAIEKSESSIPVVIKAAGTSKYEAFSKTVYIKVTGKKVPQISVKNQVVRYNETANLGVTTDSDGKIVYELVPVVAWDDYGKQIMDAPDVISVDQDGTVHGLEVGSQKVRISVEETDQYMASEVVVDVISSRKALTTLETDVDALELKETEVYELTPVVKRHGEVVNNVTVTYESGDAGIATVSGGKVTGISEGSTYITIKVPSDDNYEGAYKTIPVKVTEFVPGTAIPELEADDMVLEYGQTKAINVTKHDGGALSYTIAEGSEDIIEVDRQGNVRGIAKGVATIYIKSAVTLEYAEMETPIRVEVKGMETYLNMPDGSEFPDNIEIPYGTVYNIGATSSTGAEVSYSMEEGAEEYISIDDDDGIHGLKPGGPVVVTLTVPAVGDYGGVTKTVNVTVTKNTPELIARSPELHYGESGLIEVYYSGDGKLEFSSSDNDAVSVNKTTGEVTALRTDGATITIKAPETDYCEAVSTTVPVGVLPKATYISAGGFDVMETETKTIEYETNYPNTENITFESADPEIAEVDEKTGAVTGVKASSEPVEIKMSAPRTPEYEGFEQTISVLVTELTPGSNVATISAGDMQIDCDETKNIGAVVDSGGTLYYELADTESAEIIRLESDGSVTGLKTGIAHVNITAGPTREYQAVTVPLAVNIIVTGKNSGVTLPDLDGLTYDEDGNAILTLEYRKTINLGATAESGMPLVYQTLDPGIISLDSVTGDITGIKITGEGEYATVYMTAPGDGAHYEESYMELKVKVVPASPEITITNTSVTYNDSVNIGAHVDSEGTLHYTSSDPDTIEIDIDTGEMTAKKMSEAPVTITITADENGNYKAGSQDFEITVDKAFPIILAESVGVRETGTKQVEVTVTPEDAVLQFEIIPEKEDEIIATVDKDTGVVTGVKTGHAKLKITAGETDQYRSDFAMVDLYVDEFQPGTSRAYIENIDDYIEIQYGESLALEATSTSGSNISYVSSNSEIVSVGEDGKTITGNQLGEVQLKVTSAPTLVYAAAEKTIVVKVIGADPVFEDVKDEYTVAFGETLTFAEGAKFETAADSETELATDKLVPMPRVNSGVDVTFANQNSDIITMDVGEKEVVVRGIEVGTAYIKLSATEANGNIGTGSKTIKINVVPAEPEIILVNTSVDYKGTAALEIQPSGKDGNDKYTSKITFTNDDETYVKIDEDGIMTGVHAGSAEIGYTVAATRHYREKSGTIEVTVNKIAPKFKITPINIMMGETAYIEPVCTTDSETVFSFLYQNTKPKYAEVEPATGKVTTIKPGGRDIISASYGETDNYKSGVVYTTATVTEFIPGEKDPELNVIERISIGCGETVTPEVSAVSPGEITYSVPDEYKDFITVNNKGQIMGKSRTEDGSYALVNVDIAATRDYKADSKTIQVTVRGLSADLALIENPDNPNITSEGITIKYGETVTFDLTSKSVGVLTCTSRDTGVAFAEISGRQCKLTGTGVGSTSLVIQIDESGSYASDYIIIPITVEKATPTISVTNTKVKYGFSELLNVDVSSKDENPVITFTSKNEHITVDRLGNFKGDSTLNDGEILVEVGGTANYEPISETVYVTVEKSEAPITIDDELLLIYDQTVQLKPKSDATATFNYDLKDADDDEVVEFDKDTGEITGKSAGEATVVITTDETQNYLPAYKEVKVNVIKATPEIVTAQEPPFFGYIGERPFDIGAFVIVNDTIINGMTLEYSSSDESVALVDEYGNVQMLKAQDAEITITAAGVNGKYNAPTPKVIKVTGMATVPGAPPLLRVSEVDDGAITLEWDVPESDGGVSIENYVLMKSSNDGESFEAIASNIPADTLSYKDTDVINGKVYTYYIFAVNSMGRSKDNSNYVEAKSYTVPGKPDEFSAKATSASSVMLTWLAPDPENNGGDEIKDYKIRVYTEDGKEITKLVRIGERQLEYDEKTGLEVYTAPVTGLVSDILYTFTIESVNSATEDGKQGEVSTTSARTWSYAAPPDNIKAEPVGNGEIDITWDAPENDGHAEIVGYVVEYRAYGQESEWNNVTVEDNSCHLENLTVEEPYEYEIRIATINERGTGSFSDAVVSKVVKRPDAPILIKAEPTTNGARVTARNTNSYGNAVKYYKVCYDSKYEETHIHYVTAPADNEDIVDFEFELPDAEAYTVKASAVNDGGESEWSDGKWIMPGSPTSVKNLKASLEPGQQMAISFDASEGNGSTISGYDIYIGGTLEGADIAFEKADPAKLTKISDTEYSYDASDRINGDVISVYVVARNAVSEAKSETVSVSIGAPGATTIKDCYTDNNGVHVEWTPSNPNGYAIEGYTIYITDEDGNKTPIPAPNDGSYKAYVTNDDYPFEPGKTYEVTMTSSNRSGESTPSDPVTFTFGTPSKPKNVIGEPNSGALQVSFNKPEYSGSSTIDGYYIYLNNDSDPVIELSVEYRDSKYYVVTKDMRKDTVIDTVSQSREPEDFSVYVDGLANGVLYDVYVSARNSYGEGLKAMADIAGTTATAAGAPVKVKGEPVSGTQIDVSWSKPASDGGSAINKYVIAAYEVARKNYTTGEYEAVTETKAGEKESANLSVNFDGLSAGSEYVFRVAAITDAGQGDWSEKSEGVRTFTRPSKPVIEKLISGLGTSTTLPLTVKWAAPEDDGGTPITGYDIFVKTENGTTMQMNLDGGKIAADKTEYTISDARLKNGKQYSVTVVAYNDVTGNSNGVSSDSKSIKLGTIYPPENITATADAAGNINVSWPSEQYDDIKRYIDSYVIYAGGTMAATTNTNSGVLSGFKPGDTVTIEVSVMNIYGNEGNKSDPVTVTVGAPATVTNLKATAAKDGAVLSWNEPEGNVDGYNIYVDGAVYDTASASDTGKTITGLKGGKEYEIAVAAVNTYGEGVKSNTVKVSPWSTPDASEAINIKHGDGSFSFTVKDGNGNGTDITGHKIYVDGALSSNASEKDGIITVKSLSNDRAHEFYIITLGTAPNGTVLESAKSDTYSVRTGVPDAPEYLKAVAGNGEAEVIFSKSPDVSSSYPTLGYQITQDGLQLENNVLASSISADGKYRVTVKGLENGRTYNYAVRAYNGIGYSEYTQNVSVIPGTPKDPVITEVKPLSESLDVTWTVPESNAGKISKYIIYVNGSQWAEASDNHAVVSNLKNGVTYSVEVSAYNYIGEGAKSDPAQGTPVGVSTSITGVNIECTYKDGECIATLTWNDPSDDGGLDVTGYEVTGDSDNIQITKTPEGGKAVITGLEPGKEYKFNVVPVNDAGEGQSYTVTVNTPDVPSAPDIIEATSYNKSIITSWNAPNSNGGSAITKYIIYATPENGSAELSFEVEPTINENGEYSATITDGLELNKAYSVSVSAVNEIGEGERSRSIKMWVRDALKPTVPGAPQDVTASARDSKVVISWKAPLNDGTRTITQYNIWGGNVSAGESGMSLVGTTDGYTFTCLDEGLVNGVERMYRVNAVNDVSSEGGAFSETVKATPIHMEIPTEPKWPELDKDNGVSAYEMDPTGNRMTLTWLASTADVNGGEISYQIYINDMLQDTVKTTTYTFSEVINKKGVASALEEGKIYNVRINAVDEAENVNQSELISVNKQLNIRKGDESQGFTYDSRYANSKYAAIDADYDGEEDNKTSLGAPSAPRNVSLTLVSDTEAYITWIPPESDGGRNINGYNVYINNNKIDIPADSHRDGDGYKYEFDLRYGQMYIIYVAAYNDIDEGAISEKQFINPTIESPSGLIWSIDSEGKTTRDEDIELTWDVPNNEATAYMLYVNGVPETLSLDSVRKASSGGMGLFSASEGSKLTYTYQGEIGNMYNFAVSSMYDEVESNLTNTVEIDTRETLPIPVITKSDADNGVITLEWTVTPEENDAEIAKYYIYANGEKISESTETTTDIRLFESALIKVAAVSKRGTVGTASRPVDYNNNSGKTYSTDAPPAPQNIDFTLKKENDILVKGEDNVTVTWEPGVPDENYTGETHHYYVYLDTNPRVLCSTAEFTFEAEAGKDYYIKVEPVTSEGEPGPQATKILTIPENNYILPEKPTNPKVELDENRDKAVITWDNDDPDTTYYLIVNGEYVTDENGDKVPITNGYEYSLEGDEGGNKNFQIEAVKTYSDGAEKSELSDMVTVNTTGTDSVDNSYNSDKPVITSAISSGTKVKVFWDAPEPRMENGELVEKGTIAEYKILIDGVEQSDAVKADGKLVYEVDLGSLGAKAEVKVRAYKYINGQPYESSISDPWTISPNVNQVVNEEDYEGDNPDAPVTKPDTDHDGSEDTQEKDIRIPINVPTEKLNASLTDTFGKQREVRIEKTDEGKFELVIKEDNSFTSDSEYTLVISGSIYTSYTLTNIPDSELSNMEITTVKMYAGDLNKDGIIDAIDSSMLVDNILTDWHSLSEEELFEMGNLNGDTVLDAIDMSILNPRIGYSHTSEQWAK